MTQRVPTDLMNIANQAEAQAGMATDKVMTPLRVREAINAAPGTRVLLATLTASSSSELLFTGFNSTLYDDYEIIISGLAPSADGAGFYLRMSTDGGATYMSAAGRVEAAQAALNANAALNLMWISAPETVPHDRADIRQFLTAIGADPDAILAPQ